MIQERSYMGRSGCKLVEVIPGKVSGAPLLVGTRIPVAAILDHYKAFVEEGSQPEEAIAGTLDCHPTADAERVRQILAYDYAREAQLQQ